MNDKLNNAQESNNASSVNREKAAMYSGLPEAALIPRTIMIGDTKVRLSFSDSGDLNKQLANAFKAMLK